MSTGATKWVEVDPGEHAEFGVRYRTSLVYYEHTFPVFGLKVFGLTPKVGTLLAGGRIRIVGREVYAPGLMPADMRGGQKVNDWGVRLTWEKVGEGTPIATYAAAIVIVVAVVGFMWILAAKTTQKEMHQVFDDVRDTIKDAAGAAGGTIFNPGFIIAAMVVAVLALKRR